MNRTISTAAELDALPAWAAVEDVLGVAWVKHPAMPGRADVWVSYYGEHVAPETPLTVLHDPSATREEVRDEIAGHPIGSGYYGTSVGVDEAFEIADALLDRFTITPRTDR